MKPSSLFKVRTEPTKGVLDLLESTTLGTNGAKYKHLDTSNRIKEADKPLFLSLERNDKVLANVTFCQRDNDWYIRYFAFASVMQGGEKKKKEDKGNSLLKRELRTFFNSAFEEKGVRSMYAYIDPRNDRSKWMSVNFDFQKIGTLVTQSYSCLRPKASSRLKLVEVTDELRSKLRNRFSKERFFTDAHLKNQLYILKEGDEIIAHAQITKVHWQIIRLPGKNGALLTKLIPFIPFVNQLIKPKNHQFLVPDFVWAKNNDPRIVEELLNGILNQEKHKVMLWWMDEQNPLYKSLQNTLSWGLLHRLIGAPKVDVMCRNREGVEVDEKKVQFVTAYDMV